MAVMAKNKPKAAGDAPKRQGIFLSPEWHRVAIQLAAADRRPISWFVVAYLKERAEAAGIDVPLAPWEDEAGEK